MNKIREIKNNKKFQVFMALLKFGLLLGILVGIPLYIYFFHKEVIETMSSLESVKAYFNEHKGTMALTYMGAQCIQIIICLNPRTMASNCCRVFLWCTCKFCHVYCWCISWFCSYLLFGQITRPRCYPSILW